MFKSIYLSMACSAWCSTVLRLRGSHSWFAAKKIKANMCVFINLEVVGINFCKWDSPNCVWAVKQYIWGHSRSVEGHPFKCCIPRMNLPLAFFSLALKHVFSQYLIHALKKKNCVYVSPPLGHRFELFSWCSY